MGKRSKNRKKRRRWKKAASKQLASLPNLLQKARKALQRGDEDTALRALEKAYARDQSPPLVHGLAELCLRKALYLMGRYKSAEAINRAIERLERARALRPEDPRFSYYLGLAHHRMGELEQAISFYKQTLELDSHHSRAAYHLTLALLEKGDAPWNGPAWDLLSPQQQGDFRAAYALLQGENPKGDELHPLWKGLGYLAQRRRNFAQAAVHLEQAANSQTRKPAYSHLAQAYLGNLTWRGGDEERAFTLWQQAAQGLSDIPWLERNLAIACVSAAHRALENDNPEEALSLAEKALTVIPDDAFAKDIAAQAHFLLGNEAAREGRWEEALAHWEKVRDLGKISRPLLRNLALGYEHTEDLEMAAEAWREFLRRRPRKPDHPEALPPQQETLLRRHLAELYMHLGEEDEVIRFYRQALKTDPDNTELRLELVDFLIDAERWIMAGNEVEKILQLEPDNIEALTRKATIYENSYLPWVAARVWEEVLEQEPRHPVAREKLARLYEQEGEWLLALGMCKEAIEHYQKALSRLPDHPLLSIRLAEAYVEADEEEKADKLILDVLDKHPGDPKSLLQAVGVWALNDRWDKVESLLQYAERFDRDTQARIYGLVALNCYRMDEVEKGDLYFDKALERAAIPDGVFRDIILLHLADGDVGRARKLAQKFTERYPQNPYGFIGMAMVYAHKRQGREAKRALRKAREIARRSGMWKAMEIARALEDVIDYVPPYFWAEAFRDEFEL